MVAPPPNDPRRRGKHQQNVMDNKDEEEQQERLSSTALDLPAQPSPMPENNKNSEYKSDDERRRQLSVSIGYLEVMGRVSDRINENLVAARYGVMATMGLLVAYGISQSPLMFRYRTVADIPANYMIRRKYIHGRLMICCRQPLQPPKTRSSNSKNSSSSQVLTCYVRHLSPMERLLPKSWLEFLLKLHPAATFRGSKPEESPHELLRIQIAGIQYPPTSSTHHTSSKSSNSPIRTSSSSKSSSSIRQSQIISLPDSLLSSSSSSSSDTDDFLDRLAQQRTRVKCQLLGRRRIIRRSSSYSSANNNNNHQEDHTITTTTRTKRPIPGITPPHNNNETTITENIHNDTTDGDYGGDQEVVAVLAKLYFRPHHQPSNGGFRLFRDDLGETMVSKGLAVVSDNGLYNTTVGGGGENDTDENNERVVVVMDNTTRNVAELQRDARYLERLSQAEYRAAAGHYGVWANETFRQNHYDVVEEAEFQQQAGWLRKAWRWWLFRRQPHR